MPVSSQIRVSINLNAQPVWGPVGYDRADYYYMPDIESYYSISSQQYTYYDDGRWISTSYLPPRYSSYDVYRGYKVVVNEPTPWMHNERYRNNYRQYRGRHNQPIIRDSRDERYYANPGHPQHNNWEQRHHDNGNHGHEGNGGFDRGHDNRGHDNRGPGNQGNYRPQENRGGDNRGASQPQQNHGQENRGHGNEGNNRPQENHGQDNRGHDNGHGNDHGRDEHRNH